MAIELLDDIIEEVMDSLGIYGACNEEHEAGNRCTDRKPCRCCASSDLRMRIERAVEIERKLAGPPSTSW